MSGFDYFNCYLEFQTKFKPVKFYSDKKEIIKRALEILVEIITDPRKNRTEFLRDIKLVYPNYFTEGENGNFEPIMDELIFFNENDENLKKRVLQHMSYYLTKGKFIRISKSLLENANLNVSSFYLKKAFDGTNSCVSDNKYNIYINGVLDISLQVSPVIVSDSSGNSTYKYPINITPLCSNASFSPLYKNDIIWKDFIFVFNTSGTPALNQLLPKGSHIQVASEFYEVFKDPLSAHFVMLDNASLLYVYSRTAQIGNDNSSLGYGGLFILLKDGLSSERVSEYTHFFQLISDYISICIAHNIMREKQLKESVKSAKAAIMSRNMSHNLGSHVMFYIKQKLESVERIFQTGALKDLVKSQSIDEFKKKIANEISLGKNPEMPFLVGLGRFMNYLQERQDFIATVATNYIPYSTTINFKDAIYDELKPEKHAQRHNGDAIGREAANLLLNYIAYSEGFTSSDNIELWFGDKFNGGNKPDDVPPELRKFYIALPGGNLGRQAFFSIMENIIRNTAKHDGKKSDGGKLKFQFDKLDYEKDLKNAIIQGHSLRRNEKRIGNRSDENKNFDVSCYSSYKNKFIYLGITIKLGESVSEKTLNSLFEGMQREYLTADGLMDEECKGLKEIRISSAWLRHHELDDEIPINEPPAVAIRKTKIGQLHHLQYIICLPIPKKVACVVSDKIKKQSICRLQSLELDLFWENDINGTLIKEIADYYFIVVDNKVNSGTFDLIQKNVGARIFSTDIARIKTFDQIHKIWLRKAFSFKRPKTWPVISILDGEESNKDSDRSDTVKIKESGTSERREEFFNNAIVHIRHYSGQPAYEEKDRKVLKNALFIEAVSGGNSSYRLVRQDKKDFAWYAKQIAAGLTKVAIFDERLYGIVMPEGKFERADVKKAVSDFCEKKQIVKDNEAWDVLLEDFCSKVLIQQFELEEDLTYGDIWDILDDNKDTKEYESFVFQELSQYISIKNYSKAWKYREAGIWTFNIKEAGNKSVLITGYNAPVSKKIGLYKEEYIEKEIAVITNNNEEIEINPKESPLSNKFDFITIHQGILDKIYSALEIDKSNVSARKEVTNKIHQFFSNKEPEKDGYLPQFIIHSGRSKPNAEDMPQKQPFLQFSALDHALRDCKYTLVELLNSAHYEESNNHNIE